MTTVKKSHRAAAEMFPLVESWQAGGQSQKQFCLEQNLTVPVFQYWMRKYQREKNMSPVDGFVAIKVQDRGTAWAGIEIIYCDGTRLRFGAEARAAQLKEMLPVFSQR